MAALDRPYPGEAVYNEPQALRLRGPLDRDALRRALNEVVRRHEALRTRFDVEDARLVQVIAPRLDVALDVEDLRTLPEDVARGGGPADRAGRTPRTPRPRARTAAPGAIAVPARGRAPAAPGPCTMSSRTDGRYTSLGRELAALYAAFHAGQPSPLPALAAQYADYAMRQREGLQGEALEKPLAYWKRTLAGMRMLELPTDRPRPAAADHRGDCVTFEIDADVTRRLKELARRERATLFMTLLAAFQVLLHRYTGQEDIAIGVPTAGRSAPGLEPLIGCFVNMLVMRGDLRDRPGFDVLLHRVRQQALEAYEHQELPFDRLVQELAPVRTTTRHPLFQVSFALHNAAQMTAWRLPGLVVEEIDGPGGDDVKFDLSLTLTETSGVLRGTFHFATALFDAATIGRMAVQLRTLLLSIAADPRQRVGRLALQSAAERERRLADGMRAPSPYPDATRLERLFEAQAAMRPDAVAVVDAKDRSRTGSSMRGPDRLARALVVAGPGSLRRACALFERTLDLAVALPAVLAAGGGYVPLDPAYPPERLAFHARRLRGGAGADDGRRARTAAGGLRWAAPARLDADAAAVAAEEALPFPSLAGPDDLCYLLYTSGSTGRPKGVEVTHRAVVNLLTCHDPAAGDRGEDVLAPRSPARRSTSSNWSCTCPFWHGAALLRSQASGARRRRRSRQALRSHGVTTFPAGHPGNLQRCCSRAVYDGHPRLKDDQRRRGAGAELGRADCYRTRAGCGTSTGPPRPPSIRDPADVCGRPAGRTDADRCCGPQHAALRGRQGTRAAAAGGARRAADRRRRPGARLSGSDPT